jgi:hypothetical protein
VGSGEYSLGVPTYIMPSNHWLFLSLCLLKPLITSALSFPSLLPLPCQYLISIILSLLLPILLRLSLLLRLIQILERRICIHIRLILDVLNPLLEEKQFPGRKSDCCERQRGRNQCFDHPEERDACAVAQPWRDELLSFFLRVCR